MQILQLVFEEEISPDSSSAKRSQTTGHLLLHLPKAKPFLQAHSKSPTKLTGTKKADHRAVKRDEQEMLVTQPPSNGTRIGEDITETTTERSNFKKHCDPCSSKFEDDPNVPPLVWYYPPSNVQLLAFNRTQKKTTHCCSNSRGSCAYWRQHTWKSSCQCVW